VRSSESCAGSVAAACQWRYVTSISRSFLLNYITPSSSEPLLKLPFTTFYLTAKYFKNGRDSIILQGD
jgi:hypothetical protein